MNGAYGYWIGCIDRVRADGSDGDLEVYEREVLRQWNRQWAD